MISKASEILWWYRAFISHDSTCRPLIPSPCIAFIVCNPGNWEGSWNNTINSLEPNGSCACANGNRVVEPLCRTSWNRPNIDRKFSFVLLLSRTAIVGNRDGETILCNNGWTPNLHSRDLALAVNCLDASEQLHSNRTQSLNETFKLCLGQNFVRSFNCWQEWIYLP